MLNAKDLKVGTYVGVMTSRGKTLSKARVIRVLATQVEVELESGSKYKYSLKTLYEVGKGFSTSWLTTIPHYLTCLEEEKKRIQIGEAWGQLQAAVYQRDYSKVLVAVQLLDGLQDKGE